jgi:hypothetical protein
MVVAVLQRHGGCISTGNMRDEAKGGILSVKALSKKSLTWFPYCILWRP